MKIYFIYVYIKIRCPTIRLVYIKPTKNQTTNTKLYIVK